MLALHLLQSALVHINILLLQAVLEVPEFHDSIGGAERRALTVGDRWATHEVRATAPTVGRIVLAARC